MLEQKCFRPGHNFIIFGAISAGSYGLAGREVCRAWRRTAAPLGAPTTPGVESWLSLGWEGHSLNQRLQISLWRLDTKVALMERNWQSGLRWGFLTPKEAQSLHPTASCVIDCQGDVERWRL